MEIRIMSFGQLEARAMFGDAGTFAAVVICSHGKDAPVIAEAPGMSALLVEHFDDVEDEVDGMDPSQAARIASFVDERRCDVSELVVACEHGESRSAGVAAAVSAYLGKDDMEIFGNPDKLPNMHCYELVCRAFGIERSRSELRERFLANARASMRR